MVCACWFLTMPVASFESTGSTLTEGSASRGEIIFAAGGCASCHATPGQPDPLKLGGGLALASPFGTFRVPNISPDPVDGIGSWSVADLANALISGVSPEGRHYYPAFPYPSYTGMRPDDVRDLYAYLQTLPRVSGRAPPHDLFLFFRIRRFVGFWKLLFFREGKSEAMLNEDPVHDRGAYLVEALAHCADCHSTRNIFGAIRPTTRFAGGPDLEGTGFVPNITPARIGGWSEGELAEMLKSGRTPNHGRVGSSMRDVVANTSQLPESDRIAIARYIKSLPARPTPHP
ncbi:c-type cytochrome [Sinorhizobium terangae]|uniref:C-type cytochrome n=2 Tax=Sinorhizobium terangae TaxID=110322 RepID=A0A6N7L9R0_SINTE|nr:c-type cytochrome [Sinorhizobium terangae]